MNGVSEVNERNDDRLQRIVGLLRKATIQADFKEPLDSALATMTDEWVYDGSYCASTVFDLRDVLRDVLKIVEANIE
jgi:hypothetical protein